MADTPHRWMSSLAALVGAIGTAYAIAYVSHFQWHFSRIFVRTDALIMAARLGIVLGLKILFHKQRKSDS
jgi:hypothetical protein